MEDNPSSGVTGVYWDRVKGGITLGAVPDEGLAALDLCAFEGELAVETIPLNLAAQHGGEFWLPSHFVSWAGGVATGVSATGWTDGGSGGGVHTQPTRRPLQGQS